MGYIDFTIRIEEGNNRMTEYLDVLNECMQPIGVATRKEVHEKGYWHQTFHCWVILLDGDHTSILFQKRHPLKDTFPNKLDVSAAGHLLQGETVQDGVRELEEELGIRVDYSELHFLGTYKGSSKSELYNDQEFNHIHLLKTSHKLTDFSIQQTELKGLYQLEWQSFLDFFQGVESTLEAIGFEYDEKGERVEKRLMVGHHDFAAQGEGYYRFVFDAISKTIG